MESKVTLFRHPVHPILGVFPIALLTMSLIFDIIDYATDNSLWAAISFYNRDGEHDAHDGDDGGGDRGEDRPCVLRLHGAQPIRQDHPMRKLGVE